MKTNSLIPAALASTLLLVAASALAQENTKPEKTSCACCAPAASSTSAAADSKAGKLVRVSDKDAAWAESARKSYPLTNCVVSGEKLGSMGKPADYVYRVDGKPDRLVRFCCAGCEEDFLKEPAKALAKIDAAASGETPAVHDAHGIHSSHGH